MAGPSAAAAAAGKGSGRGGPSSKPSAGASAGRKGNDNDDDDTPYGYMLKKKPPSLSSSSAGAGSSSGGVNNVIPKKIPSKNGVKTTKSFTIPKREGAPASPRAPSQGAAGSSGSKKIIGSSSSSPRPAGMGNQRPAGSGSGSSSARRGHDDDDDFEPKPIKLKKRPEDFTRDPHSKSSQQKRKLEEQRAKEEALKKKRRDSRGSSSSKVKVKADPAGRRGSSSSAAAPRGGGRGGGSGSGGNKPKPVKAQDRAPKRFKEMTRAEKIEQAMKTYKWWEEPELEDGKQWESLEHNGAHFAPEYKPHGVKLKYDGKDVSLTPAQEEVATFYASVSFTCYLARLFVCRLLVRVVVVSVMDLLMDWLAGCMVPTLFVPRLHLDTRRFIFLFSEEAFHSIASFSRDGWRPCAWSQPGVNRF